MKTCVLRLSSPGLAKVVILHRTRAPQHGRGDAGFEAPAKSAETEQDSKRVCVPFHLALEGPVSLVLFLKHNQAAARAQRRAEVD